jgi:type II secretory pathway pseudopilin PulG
LSVKLAVLGLLVLVPLVPVIGRQDQQPTDDQSRAAQGAQFEDGLCPLTAADVHRAKAERQSKWWPPPPVWDIYWPTLGLLIAAGIATWVGLQTLSDIKEQTDLAKLTAEATANQAKALITGQRAWIVVGAGSVPDNFDPESPTTPVIALFVQPVVRNTGRTIGWIKRGYIRRYTVPYDAALPPEPDYSGPMAQQPIEVIAPPDADIQPLFVPVPASEIAAARRAQIKLYIYGFLEYAIVGEPDLKQTRFCLEYTVPRGFDSRERGWYISADAPSAYVRST